MKTTLNIIAFLTISICSLHARETKYFTKVIHETDAPMRLDLPERLYMKITDFSQTSQNPGGNVLGSVVVYKGDAQQSGVNVLLANSHHPRGTFLAGPLSVYVHPVPGSTLLITFLLGHN